MKYADSLELCSRLGAVLSEVADEWLEQGHSFDLEAADCVVNSPDVIATALHCHSIEVNCLHPWSVIRGRSSVKLFVSIGFILKPAESFSWPVNVSVLRRISELRDHQHRIVGCPKNVFDVLVDHLNS